MSNIRPKIDEDSSTLFENGLALFRKRTSSHVHATITQPILLLLIAFRIFNALSINTFFQPDEYFQSLEPAWQMAFGVDSGAWITWEWKYHLRSAVHPAIFATFYYISSWLSRTLQLSYDTHAEMLLATPKVVQAVIAALGDYYTWRLGQKVYGHGSNEAWAVLAFTVCSPWQWFCSTRTLSNCLETTLTITALYLWPWHWLLGPVKGDEVDVDGLRVDLYARIDQLTRLRHCLLLAAVACVLRPTNLLIWICLATFMLFRTPVNNRLASFQWWDILTLNGASAYITLRATQVECKVFLREATLCGTLILTLTAMFDRMYYQQWTFPPLRFLYFNVVQSLAVIYGTNDWHYYLTQGYSLLLTTFLPFAIMGIYDSAFHYDSIELRKHSRSIRIPIRFQLGIVVLFVPLVLSTVSHKEVRFIYPLLPMLHILGASSFTSFYLPAISHTIPSSKNRKSTIRGLILVMQLALNISIAAFTTHYHQTAPLSVLTYLRQEYLHNYLSQSQLRLYPSLADRSMTIGFLMPCHSTPWRSHLVHPGIKAWALGCEPPVYLNSSERAAYVDEADQFYDNPEKFLEIEFAGQPQEGKGGLAAQTTEPGYNTEQVNYQGAWDGNVGKKVWPEYLVFFEALEETIGKILVDRHYSLCWRGWNSYFHDDRRRRGDVLVWCLKDGT